MNNALVVEEEKRDTSRLREREAELVRIVEALGHVAESKEWSTLKTYVFDGVLESLEKRMVSAANQMPLDEKEIYKLQGQIAWAKKYSNLESLTDVFRLELTNIRKQLNPPTEREFAPDTIYD